MSTFWILAAALTLAVIGVLVVPLRRRAARPPAAEQDRSNVALFEDQLAELVRDRDQGVLSEAQFEQARAELARRLLADVDAEPVRAEAAPAGTWRYAALAGVPVAAIGAYLVLGTPQAIDAQSLGAPVTAAERRQNLEAMVQRLAERLQDKPDDPEAWILLARSLQVLGRAPEAVKAFARSIELVPDSPQLYSDYADVLVAAADGAWTAAASGAVAKALELDPQHPKALWLAGTEAYAREDYRTALAYWEKLAPMAEPGSEVARIIEANIDEVKKLIAAAPAAATAREPAKDAAGTAREPAKTAAAGAISGTVALDPELAGEVKPDDVVFVFARAAAGPKMPLAIRRIRVQDLPYRFALDDSNAMAPGMTISAFPAVVVGARVSRSGDARPQPGDLEGYSEAVKPGSAGIEVRIDARVR